MSFKYRKKPVVCEAVQMLAPLNEEETTAYPMWQLEAIQSGKVRPYSDGTFHVSTEEGLILGQPGDYLVKGIEGELYPCKASIFEASHEKVEDAPPAKPAVVATAK